MDRKGKGVVSYIFGLVGGLIVLFGFKDNDRKTVYHATQAITIGMISIGASIIFSVMNTIFYFSIGLRFGFLNTAVFVLCSVLKILGLIKAINDDPDPKVFLVGDLAEKIFAKKIQEAPEAAVVPGAYPVKFDPNTGIPVTTPQANFDPNTGMPVTNPVVAPQANFDPNTGMPINNSVVTPQANTDAVPSTDGVTSTEPVTIPQTSAPETTPVAPTPDTAAPVTPEATPVVPTPDTTAPVTPDAPAATPEVVPTSEVAAPQEEPTITPVNDGTAQ